MSYLEALQTYLDPTAGTSGETLFLTPPVPPSKGSRGKTPGIPPVATFISQGVGSGPKLSVYKNQAQGTTPVVQVVIRDLDYLDGHDRAIAVFRKLGPKIPEADAPDGYSGHTLETSAPLFQGADPDGVYHWVVRFTIFIDYD